jgi:hypothetical protein
LEHHYDHHYDDRNSFIIQATAWTNKSNNLLKSMYSTTPSIFLIQAPGWDKCSSLLGLRPYF